MLRNLTRFPYLMSADGGGGGGAGDEQVEVDLPGGVKVKLSKADAAKAIAGRDKTKADLHAAQEELGRTRTEKDVAEAARAKAENEKQALEHTKKGEFDKATELLTKTHREREGKIAAQLRDKALKAAVAATPKIVPAAIDDIVDQLRARSRYDFDADAVVVLDPAGQPLKDDSGKPVQVDAWLGSFLEKRPHYLLDGTPKGTGAGSGDGGKGSGRTATAAQVVAMTPGERALFFQSGGKQLVG